MQVELYARRGSPPSDDARAILTRVRERIPFDLIEVDLDDRLRARFGRDAPVLFIDGRRAFRRKIDEALLVRKLERARAFAMGMPAPRFDVPRRTKLLFAAAAAIGLCSVFVYTAVKKLVIEPALEVRSLEVLAQSFSAPPFSLPDASGARHSLEDYRGKVVLLNFWATWCPPCREEMPSMAHLAADLAGHGDFVLLAVSVDDGWRPIESYLDEAFGGGARPFAVLADSGGKVSEAYGTTKYPETYVINRRGRVVAKFVGPRDWDDPAARHYLERTLGQDESYATPRSSR